MFPQIKVWTRPASQGSKHVLDHLPMPSIGDKTACCCAQLHTITDSMCKNSSRHGVMQCAKQRRQIYYNLQFSNWCQTFRPWKCIMIRLHCVNLKFSIACLGSIRWKIQIFNWTTQKIIFDAYENCFLRIQSYSNMCNCANHDLQFVTFVFFR